MSYSEDANRLILDALRTIDWASARIWSTLTDSEQSALLANAAIDRLATPRERPGDATAWQSADQDATDRLVGYGLIVENARLREPLLTEVGRAVVAWVEQHSTAAARDGSAGVAAEDSTEDA